MLKRKYQNYHQWPNALRVRRDHPLARGLYYCFFPYKYPYGKAEANSTPNQTVRSASTLDLNGIAGMPPWAQLRQPYSVFYINKYEGSAATPRHMNFSGIQLPMGTNIGWTILMQAGLAGGNLYIGRNFNELGGVPAFYLSATATDVQFVLGASTVALEGISVTTSPSPPDANLRVGASYSPMHRMRVYGERRYTEGMYTKVDFDNSQWTTPLANKEIGVANWVMAWTRELEPSEVFSIFSNPAQILQPKRWMLNAVIPEVTYDISAETGAYAIGGQDATFTNFLDITADAGAYTLSGQDATFTFGTAPEPGPAPDVYAPDYVTIRTTIEAWNLMAKGGLTDQQVADANTIEGIITLMDTLWSHSEYQRLRRRTRLVLERARQMGILTDADIVDATSVTDIRALLVARYGRPDDGDIYSAAFQGT